MAASQDNYVPKFGNWGTEEHVPYSVYFDEARKRRNAAKINPNDTEQNQNTISGNLASTKTSTFKTETKSGAQNGLEDGDLRRPTESPWYHHTVNIEVAISSLVHRPGRKMTTRQQNAVLDSRIGRSPISPWDRNYSTGCSQLRSVTEAAETTDHTAAVPKFGDWDESDPTLVDGYTHIFNKVREERLKGTGNVAAAAPGKPHYNDLKKHKNGDFKQHYYVYKFGKWETEEHIPYAVYFDEARKRRNVAKINPDSTQQNHNTISENLAPVEASPFQTETKLGVQNGPEDGDLRRPTESPWYNHPVNIEAAINSLVHRPGRKMTIRLPNEVSDSRIGHSPISPWDRNYSTGCYQLRSVTQGAETLQTHHTAEVPKFGDWDGSDPTLVGGYTIIFNKVREERLKGTGNVAAAAALGKPHYKDLKKQKNGAFKKCCCFPVPW